ncbi:MAG: DUF5915 domain-containing protein, partial [Acidimicrobiia bacterium]
VDRVRRYSVKPDYSRLGPRLGHRLPALAAALEKLAFPEADRLAAGGPITVQVAGEAITLEAADVEVRATVAPGWGLAEEGRLATALDLSLDAELEAEGWVRELSHHLQNARKQAGLAVEDRIRLRLAVPASHAALVAASREQLARDLLATQLEVAEDPTDGEVIEVLGVAVNVTLERV